MMREKEVRLSENRIVTRSRPWSDNFVVYEAYEPFLWNGKNYRRHSHSTCASFDNLRYGSIRTARPPDAVLDLPEASDERVQAARKFRNEQEDRAYDAILEAFPELENKGRRDFGKIIVEEQE